MHSQPANSISGAQGRPVTQTETHLSSLCGAIEDNGRLISEINGRFSQILREDSPTGKDNTSEAAPRIHLVPLADQLRSASESVQRSNEMLRSILARSEI